MPENATIEDIVNALEEKKEMVESTSMTINETGIDLNDIKNEILSLEDNWDGEGAKLINETTFARVEAFLERLFALSYERFNEYPEIPDISPGCKGEIEIYWRTEKFKLCIDIPEATTEPAIFYWDNNRDVIIKGSTLDYEKLQQVYITCKEAFA